MFANHTLCRKRTISLSIWPKEKRFLDSKEKGQQGMFPLHPSVQAGNRTRSTVALNFWLALTPMLPCAIRYLLARTRFTLARRENDAGSFAPSPFLSLRSQCAHWLWQSVPQCLPLEGKVPQCAHWGG